MATYRRRRLLLLKKKLILLSLINARRKAIRKRLYQVDPIWHNRKHEGAYETLMKHMRYGSERGLKLFRNFTRMCPELFDKLEGLIANEIKKYHYSVEVLSPGHRLAITLRFLASGDSFVSIAYLFRVGVETVRQIVLETSAVIWDILQPLYMPAPDEAYWKKSAAAYGRLWQFPNLCGAVDGKHVNLQQPPNSGSEYFNYKGTNSIVLMAVVGPNYEFAAVDIGAHGSQSDGGIFKASSIGQALDQGSLHFPEDCDLPRTNTTMPHVLVGDEAFQLRSNFMRPYPGQGLDNGRRIFNFRLSRARRCSENAFGIMVSRFRLYRRSIMMNPTNAIAVIKASVVLHNFLLEEEKKQPRSKQVYCPPGYADYMDHTGTLIDGEWHNSLRSTDALQNQLIIHHEFHNTGRQAQHVRDVFKLYFMSPEGEVNWQWDLPGVVRN